jgi:hypothetical protein
MSNALLEKMAEGPLPNTLRVKIGEGDTFVLEFAETGNKGA